MTFIRDRKIRNPFSLHDCRILKLEYKDDVLTLYFDKVFRCSAIPENCTLVPSISIDFAKTDISSCRILIFDRVIEDGKDNGKFAGQVMNIREYIHHHKNAEFEILTEGYNDYQTIYSGWIWEEEKEPVSGIIHIWNAGDIIYHI